MIELGDLVIDIVSGFTGVAISTTEYLQGCNRIGVQPKVDKTGVLPEIAYFDVVQLKVVKKSKTRRSTKNEGGPAYAQPNTKGIMGR